MDTKILNEKLLRFAGFTNLRLGETIFGNKLFADFPNEAYKPLKGRMYAPDLVYSLDAQAKWIYPKLLDLKFSISNIINVADSFTLLRHKFDDVFFESHAHREKYALAFALAVEKLIDSLNKGGKYE